MKVKSGIVMTLLGGLLLISVNALAGSQCLNLQGRWSGKLTTANYDIYPVNLQITCHNDDDLRGYMIYRFGDASPSSTKLWGRTDENGKLSHLENNLYIYGADLDVELQSADTLTVKSFSTNVFGISTLKDASGRLTKVDRAI